MQANFEGHIDWVNDVALIGKDVLLTCSNDKTLRTWKVGSGDYSALGHHTATKSSSSVSCLSGGHKEYITCLAASSTHPPLVVSGGLCGELCMWDVERSAQLSSTAVLSSSIYSIALAKGESCIVAGVADGRVLLLDPRTGDAKQVGELKGHGDTVKALLAGNGTSALHQLISGSSDRTIKTWDIGMRRCLHTYAVHTDSVWCLAVDNTTYSENNNSDSILSGGRDGCVYRTHLGKRRSELLVHDEDGIACMAVAHGGSQQLWTGTSTSSVKRWSFEAGNDKNDTPCRDFAVPHSSSARLKVNFSGVGEKSNIPLPRETQPSAVIAGLPPLKAAAALTDKRHIITQDSFGEVVLWDITKCAQVKVLGHGKIQDFQQSLFDPTYALEPWFSLDTKLGSLAITLTPPKCFSAEVYVQDLGYRDLPADLKVNYGERLLKAVFKEWVSTTTQETDDVSMDLENGPDSLNSNASVSIDSTSPEHQLFSFQWDCTLPPIVVLTHKGCPLRISAANVGALEKGAVPTWIRDCVLQGVFPGCKEGSKEMKLAFVLLPAEGSGLPRLSQSKLNAPRVLRIDKTADYIVKKLAEQGVELGQEPLFWNETRHEEWVAMHHHEKPTQSTSSAGGSINFLKSFYGSGESRSHDIHLTCNGLVVPWDFSLAAVRKYIWKRPANEDLRIEYGLRDAAAPLKLPNIRPA